MSRVTKLSSLPTKIAQLCGLGLCRPRPVWRRYGPDTEDSLSQVSDLDRAIFVVTGQLLGRVPWILMTGWCRSVRCLIGRDHLARSTYVLCRAPLDDLVLPVPGTVQVPPAFPGEAAALLAATREQGLEGIALKRPASLYHPGRRTRDWLKIRHIHTVAVRVGGWLPSTGARAYLARSVLMGLPRPGAMEFAGTVRSGMSMAELRELTTLLESLEQRVPPFTGPLPPRSPSAPGGRSPSSPPRSPISSAPHPGGYANRSGAA